MTGNGKAAEGVRLVIELIPQPDGTAQVRVDGPIDDRLRCYDMMAAAAQVLQQREAQQKQQAAANALSLAPLPEETALLGDLRLGRGLPPPGGK